jgi:membrane protein required for colicin V production
LNWLDLLIVLLITVSAFFGYRKGFLRKVLGIAGIILGFILAVRFYKPIASVLSGMAGSSSSMISVIAFLLIIGFVFGLAVWVARFIAGMNSGTSITDKVLGAITGFLQGLILASVLLVNMSFANEPEQKVREGSLLYSRVYSVAPELFDKILALSPELKSMYIDYKNKLIPVNTNEQDTNHRR